MGLEITKWNRLMTAGIAERMYHRPKSAFKEKQNPLGAYMIELCEDMYYFIYSSQKNHELCYATSKYPDHGFVYGGTIISNGDVGYKGRRDEQRLNTTGTTHGSMENINGQWYVFYHRLSHGSDYSRQACAELIDIKEDGTIEQVEMTSCG